jgi:hypothetical protein
MSLAGWPTGRLQATVFHKIFSHYGYWVVMLVLWRQLDVPRGTYRLHLQGRKVNKARNQSEARKGCAQNDVTGRDSTGIRAGRGNEKDEGE